MPLKNAPRPKYGNKKCQYRGIKFDSRKEMMRYIELESMFNRGKLKSVKCQHPITVLMNNKIICKLVVDFMYNDNKGNVHYEDVKTFDIKTQKFLSTPVFKLKKKLVEAQFGIKIELF